MQSKATTVAAYLAELPPDRRDAIEQVREVILANLDKDYAEGMAYGAIGYFVPHSVFPQGYHCNPKMPLPFAGLASQKHYMTVGLMSIYGDPSQLRWFTSEWTKTGKKLDMGKCCIRFKKVEDLALDVIAQAVRNVPASKYVEQYIKQLKSSGIVIKHASSTSAKSSDKPAQPVSSTASKKSTKKATRKVGKKTGTKSGKKAAAKR